jgi:2-methylcitrate dehydratase PrpD
MVVELTHGLVDHARSITPASLSNDARRIARDCAIDTLAVAVAGADTPLVHLLLADLADEAAGSTDGATVIGHATRLPPRPAALVNGAMAHALDYDDVNMAIPGHPSTAILPALWALAERRDIAAPEAVETAFVAGYDVACRLGRVIAPGHYDGLGFHATGTIGCIGAAAACAHLLGLDETAFAHAIGLAATSAAGLKSMFGSMAKPLHAGRAASDGLMAATLAARGFTARTDALECPQGFCATHSPDFAPAHAFETPEGGLYIRANLFKFHAACYLTHAPIECARSARTAHDVRPDGIARIVLRVDQAVGRVCDILAPSDGLEAKFSLRLAVALGLMGVDTARLETFGPATIADPALSRLRDRVEVVFERGWPHTRAVLLITNTDGRMVETTHDSGVPAIDPAAQSSRVAAKARALMAPRLGDAGAEAVLANPRPATTARS